MDDVNAPPHNDDAHAAHLGPLVLACRDRRDWDVEIALGRSPAEIIAMCLLVPLLPSVILAAGSLLLLGRGAAPNPVLGRFVLAAAYLVFCMLLFWITLRPRRRCSLALYEQGIRYKKDVIYCDEIASIRRGRVLSSFARHTLGLVELAAKVKSRHRETVRLAKAVDRASLTIVCTDGWTVDLKAILARAHPDDLRRFLDWVQAHWPGLIEDGVMNVESQR